MPGIELESRELNEAEQTVYEDLLPYLLKYVDSNVIYEYACTDDMRLAWAKHLFITRYSGMLARHSFKEVKAVIHGGA